MEPVDPSRKHFIISLFKSFIRIAAGVSLTLAGFMISIHEYQYEFPDQSWVGYLIIFTGVFLTLAEFLGILEEL